MICKNADNCSKYKANYGNPYPHQSPCEHCKDYEEPELRRGEVMNNLITVSYDNNEPDFPTIACFIHKRASRESQEMRVAYVGEEAEELYKIVTQQGYLKELLNR